MVSLIREKNKLLMERKWTDRQYDVQDKSDISHKYVRMYCNTNHLSALPFCGTNSRPHGAKGLSKNYHLRFGIKLGNGVCSIFRITCACVACKSMIDKPWISVIPPDAQ